MGKIKININTKNLGKDAIRFFKDNVILVLLVLLVLYTGITKENFFTFANFSNIASNVTPRFIIALGVSGCLITKGTDLSAGRAVGLAGVLACTLLQRPDYSDKYLAKLFPGATIPDFNIYLILIIVAVVLGIFGLMNGVIISFFKVPPFLATLGMQTVIYGVCSVYSGAQPIGGLKPEYTGVASTSLFSIGNFQFKFLFLFAIVAGIIFWFLYNKMRYGKYMYAIGGNENAAEVSGVNVNKSKILIYTLAGVMYGIGGFLLASKSGGASVNLGQGYELEAIAACTIGGVSSNGGVGKVSGILLGVLVFELLKTSMQYHGINPFYQQIVQGIVIIVAVAFDIRKYIKKS